MQSQLILIAPILGLLSACATTVVSDMTPGGPDFDTLVAEGTDIFARYGTAVETAPADLPGGVVAYNGVALFQGPNWTVEGARNNPGTAGVLELLADFDNSMISGTVTDVSGPTGSSILAITLDDGVISGNTVTGLIGGTFPYTVKTPDDVPDIMETANIFGTFEANFLGAAGEALSGTLSGSATLRDINGDTEIAAFGGALLAER